MPSDFHVQFSPEEAGLLAHMANMEKKPVDVLLQELTLEAMEKREDFYLSKLADSLYGPAFRNVRKAQRKQYKSLSALG